MYVWYNGRTYYRPIFEVQILGLLPYMVAWISTGNEHKTLLNLSFKFAMFQPISYAFNMQISLQTF